MASSLCMVMLSQALCVSGNVFLHASGQKAFKPVARKEVERTLLSEISGLVSPDQVRSIEEELHPTFAAVPKNSHGLLDSTTVRYVLHRFFSRKHGWFVQGLDPAGDMWDVSSPTSVMEDLAPFYIQKVFDQRLQGQGLGLHEIAVFAATLLDLIHTEAISQLERLYTALHLPTSGPVPHEQSEKATNAYLMEYILGITFNGTNLKGQMDELDSQVMEVYPGWDDTILWAQDLLWAHSAAERFRNNPFERHSDSFDDTVSYVKELGHRFGSFQNLECKALKSKLVEMEVHGTGRVPLRSFYAVGLEGEWQFTESQDYLRSLGVLDDNDLKQPLVVIPNYVNSQSNCLTPSSLYSVCCLDECERLLGQVEEEIAAPQAAPGQIAEVIKRLSSDTVEAPRNLSVAMLSRLDEIAHHHHGTVLLHGRLFAQWMHHAYPRECPFPHVAGTRSQITPLEWMTVTGLNSSDASDEELRRFATGPQEKELEMSFMTLEDKLTALPWTAVEEQLSGYRHTSKAKATPWAKFLVPTIAAYAAMAGLVVPLWRDRNGKASTCSIAANQLDRVLV